MKFLCFHGTGTSNGILMAQTAALRYELGDTHTFTFVEGCLPVSIAPELRSLFDVGGDYYDYCDTNSAASCIQAVHDIGPYLAVEGPFDAVLGFSGGAALAATYLARHATLHPRDPPPFRCAVFISAMGVLDWKTAEIDGEGVAPMLDIHDDSNSTQSEMVSIPTCHIYGLNDDRNNNAKILVSWCDESRRQVVTWNGDHEIPGSGNHEVLEEAVRAVKRTIDMAQLEQ